MEVTDLSELCRLCLDSSTELYPFETPVHFSKKSLPQLVKYCTDVDCSGNDGGIAPKNVCQSCLELLKIVFEFKSKSQESDRYLKQIISHSIAREAAPLIPATIANEAYEESYQNEEDLLQPLDDDDDTNDSLQETKKGQRHGDFECQICNKFFKYVKPYKNHMKMHNVRRPGIPKVKEKLSYYKRKKLQDALQNVIPKKKPPVPTPKRTSIQYADSSPEPQPEYDSLSPYQNSPAYEDDSIIPQDNHDDMDFGALMLSTSQMIGEEVEKDNPEPRKSRTGRILKRSIIEKDEDEEIAKPNGQKRSKPSSAPSKAPPTKKPGPLSSKSRSKPAKQNDSEEITIEGFSEVDISKMLKKSSDSMTRLTDQGSKSYQASTSQSRSRSSSVELIDETDIFDL